MKLPSDDASHYAHFMRRVWGTNRANVTVQWLVGRGQGPIFAVVFFFVVFFALSGGEIGDVVSAAISARREEQAQHVPPHLWRIPTRELAISVVGRTVCFVCFTM